MQRKIYTDFQEAVAWGGCLSCLYVWNFVYVLVLSLLCLHCGQPQAQHGWERAFGRLQMCGFATDTYLNPFLFFWIGQRYSHYAISLEPVQPVWVSDRCQGLNVGVRTESSSHLPHALSLARRLRLPPAKPAHGDKGVHTNQPHGAGLGVLFRNLRRGL